VSPASPACLARGQVNTLAVQRSANSGKTLPSSEADRPRRVEALRYVLFAHFAIDCRAVPTAPSPPRLAPVRPHSKDRPRKIARSECGRPSDRGGRPRERLRITSWPRDLRSFARCRLTNPVAPVDGNPHRGPLPWEARIVFFARIQPRSPQNVKPNASAVPCSRAIGARWTNGSRGYSPTAQIAASSIEKPTASRSGPSPTPTAML
jgi:hypothetical protein